MFIGELFIEFHFISNHKGMPFNSTNSSSEICPQEVKYILVHIQLTLKYLPDSFCGNKYMKYTCKVCKEDQIFVLDISNNMSSISKQM